MAKKISQQERQLQLQISQDVFNRVSTALLNALPSSFHAAPNARYKAEEIMKYLMLMCSEHTSHEGISQMYKDKTDGSRVPTGATLLNRIGGSSYDMTRSSCNDMLNATLTEPWNRGMLCGRVITATDEHDISTHIKNFDDEYMATGKPKDGTSKKLRNTTINVVGDSVGFVIAARPTGKKHKKADIVRDQILQIREMGIRSKLHLLDKGFYEVEVMKAMIDIKQLFLMPAVNSPRIIEIIEKQAAGTGKDVLPYTIKGKKTKVTVTLVIVKNKKAKRDDPIEQRYLAFVTNADLRKAKKMKSDILKNYKKRWRIETGYRCAKQIRPFTCARNMSVRLVLFYFTMILYNIWALSNWLASDKTIGGKKYVRPPITMYRMLGSFRRICKAMIIDCIVSDLFFAEEIP